MLNCTAFPTTTASAGENSEVFPFGSVAVARTDWPIGTTLGTDAEKVATPLPSVVAVVWPRNRPFWAGSAEVAKNWIVKVVLGVLESPPWIVVLLLKALADVRMGVFCRLFGPASPSPGSFGVTPPGGSEGTAR